MLANRGTKAIMSDIADSSKIEFLRDLVEKTEKREFNCTLCHTLMRMFALSKSP